MLHLLDHISRLTGIRHLTFEPTCAEADDEVTLDVPGFQQVDTFSCGAIAGFSVVSTFHPDADFDAFYEVIKPVPEAGVDTPQMLRALRRFRVGFKVRDYMSFEQIVRSIDDGFPIIVGRLTEHGQDHWSVLYGYGQDPKSVFLLGRSANPLFSPKMDWDSFRSSFRAVRGPAIQCWGRE